MSGKKNDPKINLREIYGDGYDEISDNLTFTEAVKGTNFIIDCQMNHICVVVSYKG